MFELSDEQKADYFRRSFTAADGLWCMKVEERYGFDTALAIDAEVWAVVPKIQARMFQSFSGESSGMEALLEALETKLDMEGFTFEIRNAAADSFEIAILECPWHMKMVQSGRARLSEKVGLAVCTTEFAVWAAEYGDGITFKLTGQVCGGDKACVLSYTRFGNE
ncbi:MAG: hypothetical protein J7M24_02025 [Candidatus Latescibacteria bacterium]|nr:hypothetical protein [Candidatus Latescibacterota bacterium]